MSRRVSGQVNDLSIFTRHLATRLPLRLTTSQVYHGGGEHAASRIGRMSSGWDRARLVGNGGAFGVGSGSGGLSEVKPAVWAWMSAQGEHSYVR